MLVARSECGHSFHKETHAARPCFNLDLGQNSRRVLPPFAIFVLQQRTCQLIRCVKAPRPRLHLQMPLRGGLEMANSIIPVRKSVGQLTQEERDRSEIRNLTEYSVLIRARQKQII